MTQTRICKIQRWRTRGQIMADMRGWRLVEIDGEWLVFERRVA